MYEGPNSIVKKRIAQIEPQGSSWRALLGIGDLDDYKCRRRQLLLPSTQNAAVDNAPASDLNGTRSILRGLTENLALVRLLRLTGLFNFFCFRLVQILHSITFAVLL